MQPALHAESVREQVSRGAYRQGEISNPPHGGVACPRPCTQRPYHHHRVFQGCGSARWIGQSCASSAAILGWAVLRVNDDRRLTGGSRSSRMPWVALRFYFMHGCGCLLLASYPFLPGPAVLKAFSTFKNSSNLI